MKRFELYEEMRDGQEVYINFHSIDYGNLILQRSRLMRIRKMMEFWRNEPVTFLFKKTEKYNSNTFRVSVNLQKGEVTFYYLNFNNHIEKWQPEEAEKFLLEHIEDTLGSLHDRIRFLQEEVVDPDCEIKE